MSTNDTVKSIHRLATMRDGMGGNPLVRIVLEPQGGMSPGTGEAADTAVSWLAQTYQGKGQWGSLAGEGLTPEEALNNLHASLVHAHAKVDARRAKALAAAPHRSARRDMQGDSACVCPPKPRFSPGSLASGSATEDAAHDRWEAEHGHHANAAAAR